MSSKSLNNAVAGQTGEAIPQDAPQDGGYVKNDFSAGGLAGVNDGPRKPPPPGPPGRMATEKAKDLKGTVRKLLKFISPFKFMLLVAVLAAIGSTAFNVVGPKVLSMATTEVFNGVTGANASGVDFNAVGLILLAAIALYAASTACNFLEGWLMTGVTQKLCYNLRQEIDRKIDRMPFKFFERNPVGDTLSRITNDVDTFGQSFNQSVTQALTSTVTVIGVLAMMLSINALMTLIAVLVVPLSLGFTLFIVKRTQKYFEAQQNILGEVDGCIEETFSGQGVVKAFCREEATLAQFNDANERLYQASWKSQFYSGLVKPVMDLIGNLGYVAVALVGAFFAMNRIITVGDIQAFIQYVKNLTRPITQLTEVMNMIQQMGACAERIFEFLDEEEEVDPLMEDAQRPLLDASRVEGNVNFDHVRFGYDPANPVIHDFSAQVSAGQTVALVGPTGSGKTTMVKLLMRFYDVDAGGISIDGVDARRIPRAAVRNMFGMVLQETWLYNASIRENIRYGRLDASDKEVEAAAKAGSADEFIRMLPGGYDFIINEDASNISLGQRQLLTIARAILANRPMLILDEATSSVDTRTEEHIQQAMDRLMRGRTSFVIAHRLSTIRDADLILVIKDGDIVEQGTHDELLAQDGFYADLYNSQFEDCD